MECALQFKSDSTLLSSFITKLSQALLLLYTYKTDERVNLWTNNKWIRRKKKKLKREKEKKTKKKEEGREELLLLLPFFNVHIKHERIWSTQERLWNVHRKRKLFPFNHIMCIKYIKKVWETNESVVRTDSDRKLLLFQDSHSFIEKSVI